MTTETIVIHANIVALCKSVKVPYTLALISLFGLFTGFKYKLSKTEHVYLSRMNNEKHAA